MLATPRRSIALTLLALTATAPVALAQNTFNPYGNSGYADYREFTTPMYSNDPSLPGQARLQGQGIGGRNSANQYEAYTSGLSGRESEASAGTRNGRPAAGPGVPYFQAYRQYDEQYKRVYKPNASDASRKFDDSMKKRDADYAKALDERDPVKRARMIRQIEQYSANRPATRAGVAAPARSPAPRGARAPRPGDHACPRPARHLRWHRPAPAVIEAGHYGTGRPGAGRRRARIQPFHRADSAPQ